MIFLLSVFFLHSTADWTAAVQQGYDTFLGNVCCLAGVKDVEKSDIEIEVVSV